MPTKEENSPAGVRTAIRIPASDIETIRPEKSFSATP